MYTRTRNLTVALAAGALAAPLILSGCSSDSSEDADSSTSATATVTETVVPGGDGGGTDNGGGDTGGGADTGGGSGDGTPAPGAGVNTDGLDPAYINADSVRAWATDIAAGDTAGMTGKCWTMPAGYVESNYTGAADRIVEALATAPIQAQDGYVWGADSVTEVRVPWSEGESDYACPKVDLDGDHNPPDSVVLWTAQRFLLREQGSPVNPADTGDAYPLRCAYSQNPVEPGAVEDADPEALTIVTHDRDHGKWYLTNSGARVDMSVENGRVCVAGVEPA